MENIKYNENMEEFLENEISPEEHDELIATLEQFLNVEDGKFVFEEVPSNVYVDFEYEMVDELIKGVNTSNELAEYGEVKINNDLTITVLGEDESETIMPMARGVNRNINRQVRFWWGTRNYMNRARTRDRIGQFRRASSNWNAASWALKSIVKAFPPSAVGVIATKAFAQNAKHKARRLEVRLGQSTTRGTILDYHLTGTWATRKQ